MSIDWHSSIADEFHDKYEQADTFIERKRIWRDLIDRHVAARATVLDAGCGPGIISCFAARRAQSVLGVDGSPEMLELASRRARSLGLVNLSFLKANIEDQSLFHGILM
jgi:23S rRNA (uracil1939-C5)-methyltransferase